MQLYCTWFHCSTQLQFLLEKAFLCSASPTGWPPALKIALNMEGQSCKEVSSPGHLLPTALHCTSFLSLATQTSSERSCVMLRKELQFAD